jgi:hypothetical protein
VGFVTAIVSLAAGAVLFFLPLFDEAFHANHPFLYHLDFGLILIGLLYFYEARAIRHRLAYGEEEDGVFGYDFSFGYTSLDRTATRERKRAPLLAGLRRRLRERDQEQKRRKEELLRSQLDQVLAKISRDGMESLSRQERRFLERASKKLRK